MTCALLYLVLFTSICLCEANNELKVWTSSEKPRDFSELFEDQLAMAKSKIKYSHIELAHIPSNFAKVAAFWYYFLPVFQCPLAQRLPALAGDGPKYVCNVDIYRYASDCLIYSFGVSSVNASVFDFALIKAFPHCEIHMFDHAPRVPFSSIDSVVAQIPNIHFHHIGLASARNRKHPKLKSLGELIEMLNHQERTIHALKIDIEGAEWKALPAGIDEAKELGVDILELQIELHSPVSKVRHAVNWFKGIERRGFLMYIMDPNFFCPHCMEYAWIHESVGTGIYTGDLKSLL